MMIGLGKYRSGYGQEIIFEGSGHKMIIGIASDGSTYLDQNTWLPAVVNECQGAITVSNIKGYDESDDVLLSVKTDILLLHRKFQSLTKRNNIEIDFHVDKTILDNYRGKISLGFWLVNVLDFKIREMPTMEVEYCSDNLARAVYDAAKKGYNDPNRTTEERSRKQDIMKKQLKEALIFTMKYEPRKRKLDFIDE